MFRQLKYFQSVVRLNSFSEAVEENFISQSAISQQIQALERELGFPLLERKNRTFSLILIFKLKVYKKSSKSSNIWLLRRFFVYTLIKN